MHRTSMRPRLPIRWRFGGLSFPAAAALVSVAHATPTLTPSALAMHSVGQAHDAEAWVSLRMTFAPLGIPLQR
ncbi:hypothetical protein B0T16DRAFT_418899 [Cercophora newfieldiana]|uniref:Uncharacterized protein n=1 Tax=Cercophora newfieldiana TaxID=92897 RepID=A0AA39XXS2_9PEZI|nr:hypothetical protein B0T16DRAFT_418899 [Cercophora newfieldiana]